MRCPMRFKWEYYVYTYSSAIFSHKFVDKTGDQTNKLLPKQTDQASLITPLIHRPFFLLLLSSENLFGWCKRKLMKVKFRPLSLPIIVFRSASDFSGWSKRTGVDLNFLQHCFLGLEVLSNLLQFKGSKMTI